ncbi:uncharacterized protein LOC124273141 isoform X2 [Haliotis rubra]|uniref:uncharacterized protein LOC124273141 isoform X2 n=1 Tax=Haliotis rubra TaxID=36100 RepID=UPI001EE55FDA|nr:uncharacterized protein LOC124273141 isoform X2 [Haliotis rubra]
MSLRPVGCDDFYLLPLKYPKPNQCYSAAPIGRHVLSWVVKRLCARAGFQGFYTSHSLRATTATRLYESGLDEQLIAERTGHRSTAIRAYKRTSEGMLKIVDVVQRKTPTTATSATSSPTPHVSDTTDPKRRQDANCSNVKTVHFVVERDGARVTFDM